MPKKSEHAAMLFFFLRIDFMSPIPPRRLEKKLLEKRSSTWRNLKTMALRFRAQGKHFENGAFRKRWRHGDRLISLNEASSNTNPK